uniref:Uncharacterized protein n=1 Tax=Glossina brevipalpis TaxID=37001 RepID=A0A1A9X2I8_9MUSC
MKNDVLLDKQFDLTLNEKRDTRILQLLDYMNIICFLLFGYALCKNNLPFSSSMLRVIAVGVTRARVDVVCVIKYIMKTKKVHTIVEDNCGQVKSIVVVVTVMCFNCIAAVKAAAIC